MSINSTVMEHDIIQPIYPQLRFGVDLTRLYPEWYLHPAIKNLIYETRVNTERRKDFTLNEILQRENEGSQYYVEEIIYLKDRLISGKSIIGLNASPGVHMWLLKHFLGLLPAPLFTKDQVRPNYWTRISAECQSVLAMIQLSKNASSSHVEEMIACEFAQLPPRNLIFVLELFELFRCLGTKLFVKTEIDKRSSMTIVRYFTPGLFNRPFRPDLITNNDKKHFPLMLFSIFRWPSIKEKIQSIIAGKKAEFAASKCYYLPETKHEDDLDNPLSDIQEEIHSPCTTKLDTHSNDNFSLIQFRRNLCDDETIYLVDNFTQTSNETDTNEDNTRSLPYQTAERTIHLSETTKYRQEAKRILVEEQEITNAFVRNEKLNKPDYESDTQRASDSKYIDKHVTKAFIYNERSDKPIYDSDSQAIELNYDSDKQISKALIRNEKLNDSEYNSDVSQRRHKTKAVVHYELNETNSHETIQRDRRTSTPRKDNEGIKTFDNVSTIHSESKDKLGARFSKLQLSNCVSVEESIQSSDRKDTPSVNPDTACKLSKTNLNDKKVIESQQFDAVDMNISKDSDKKSEKLSNIKKKKSGKISTKVTRIRRIHGKDSQIIIVNINPCECKKEIRRTTEKDEDVLDGNEEVDGNEKNNFESPEKSSKHWMEYRNRK